MHPDRSTCLYSLNTIFDLSENVRQLRYDVVLEDLAESGLQSYELQPGYVRVISRSPKRKIAASALSRSSADEFLEM